MRLPQNEKRNKGKDLLSHPTAFASRYFVSNCAKRVNVTRSGLALPLRARLICIHTWKSGSQQGFLLPLRFFHCFHHCILARKSGRVKKKNPHQTMVGQPIPHHAHVFFERFFNMFFPKGCFGKQEGSVLGPTELLRLPRQARRNLSSPSPGFRNGRRKHLALALIYAEMLANLFYVITASCF